MGCGAGVQGIVEKLDNIPVLPALNTRFIGITDREGNFSEKCMACGICVSRCQMHAISADSDQVSVVNRAKCIGCGLCVTGCTNKVARLERKAEEEIVNPPEDLAAWEYERLVNRGLIPS